MRVERSKLAQLVTFYYQQSGRHVPESAPRQIDARDLVATLQDSLVSGLGLVSAKRGAAHRGRGGQLRSTFRVAVLSASTRPPFLIKLYFFHCTQQGGPRDLAVIDKRSRSA